jgi:hypothetical protein
VPLGRLPVRVLAEPLPGLLPRLPRRELALPEGSLTVRILTGPWPSLLPRLPQPEGDLPGHVLTRPSPGLPLRELARPERGLPGHILAGPWPSLQPRLPRRELALPEGSLPERVLTGPRPRLQPRLPLRELARPERGLPVRTLLVRALAGLPLRGRPAAERPLLAVSPLAAERALPAVTFLTVRGLRVPTRPVLPLGIGILALGPLGVLVVRVLSLPALLRRRGWRGG